jgi:hypothetical protein
MGCPNCLPICPDANPFQAFTLGALLVSTSIATGDLIHRVIDKDNEAPEVYFFVHWFVAFGVYLMLHFLAHFGCWYGQSMVVRKEDVEEPKFSDLCVSSCEGCRRSTYGVNKTNQSFESDRGMLMTSIF